MSLPAHFGVTEEELPRPEAKDYREAQRPVRPRRTLRWSWRAAAKKVSGGGTLLMGAFAGFMTSLSLVSFFAGQPAFGLVAGGMGIFVGLVLGLQRLNHSALTIDNDSIRHRVGPIPLRQFAIPTAALTEVRVARGPNDHYLAQLVHEDGTTNLPAMTLESARAAATWIAAAAEVSLLDPIAEAETEATRARERRRARRSAAGPRVRVPTPPTDEWRSSANDEESALFGDYEVFDDDERVL